jgi:Zn-dependent protease with chaperone function
MLLHSFRSHRALRRLGKLCATGLLGVSLSICMVPAQPAEASILGDVLGTAVVGTMYRDKIMAVYKKYNNTDEGRNKWFAEMKKQEAPDYDWATNNRVDTIMANVIAGIRAVDPTVDKKPYNYYVSANDKPNASCTIGHNLTIQRGILNLMANDDEIAVVLGHELGHGQKEHPIHGVKSAINAAIVAGMADAATGGIASGAINQLYVYTQNVHLTKPQEWEADNLAFDYITHTNYNPGATAACWQRFLEKYGDMNIHWSDHPTCTQRRENYVKKLYKYSNKHVTDKDGVVYVNKKQFVVPAAAGGMSSKERSYFVLGNLAAAYHNNKVIPNAYADGNTVMLGVQPIITCVAGDESADTLAARLNDLNYGKKKKAKKEVKEKEEKKDKEKEKDNKKDSKEVNQKTVKVMSEKGNQ